MGEHAKKQISYGSALGVESQKALTEGEAQNAGPNTSYLTEVVLGYSNAHPWKQHKSWCALLCSIFSCMCLEGMSAPLAWAQEILRAKHLGVGGWVQLRL